MITLLQLDLFLSKSAAGVVGCDCMEMTVEGT